MTETVKKLKALRKKWRMQATGEHNRRVMRGGDREYDARCYGMQIALEQCAEELNALIGELDAQ